MRLEYTAKQQGSFRSRFCVCGSFLPTCLGKAGTGECAEWHDGAGAKVSL